MGITRQRYTIASITIGAILCAIMLLFYLYSIDKISNIYIKNTQDTVYTIKKNMLRDTVNNLMAQIDIKRKARAELMEKLVARVEAMIDGKMDLSDNEFNDFFIRFFLGSLENDPWTVMLWDQKEGKAVYDPQGLAGSSWEDTMNIINARLSAYRLLNQGGKTVLFGVSKSYVDELVKEEMADTIRTMKFDGDSYLWVNEIINYQGGENYAIRRIHPNLPETEGMYLSTDMTDGEGNFPYLTELQGINQDGELFFSYYFKELSSDKISQKLTYAKLYKDYNWVIAMGVYLDNLDAYIDQTNKESKVLASRHTLVLVLLFLAILLISYTLIMLVEKLYYRHSQRQMESELNQDPLTKEDNRRRGTNDLIRAFSDYQKSGIGPGIMMFDIDHFKDINDNYGHAVGDQVLIEIVKAVRNMIRSSDRIIRWGGDEFIVIFYGLQERNARAFAQKVLELASSLKIPVQDEEIGLTLSIGFSFFKPSDSEFSDVIKRADEALYLSKANGRNQVNLIL